MWNFPYFSNTLDVEAVKPPNISLQKPNGFWAVEKLAHHKSLEHFKHSTFTDICMRPAALHALECMQK
jgi:hypothetical protein